MTRLPTAKPKNEAGQILLKRVGKKERQHEAWALSDVARTAHWYLTVRCINPECSRLIAFQKTASPDGPPRRIEVDGVLSIHCPHCKTLVRFGLDQIQRKHVVLTQ